MGENSTSHNQSGVKIIRKFSSPDPDDLARRLRMVFAHWVRENDLDSDAKIQDNPTIVEMTNETSRRHN